MRSTVSAVTGRTTFQIQLLASHLVPKDVLNRDRLTHNVHKVWGNMTLQNSWKPTNMLSSCAAVISNSHCFRWLLWRTLWFFLSCYFLLVSEVKEMWDKGEEELGESRFKFSSLPCEEHLSLNLSIRTRSVSLPGFIYLFVLDSFNPEQLSTLWRLVGYESFMIQP